MLSVVENWRTIPILIEIFLGIIRRAAGEEARIRWAFLQAHHPELARAADEAIARINEGARALAYGERPAFIQEGILSWYCNTKEGGRFVDVTNALEDDVAFTAFRRDCLARLARERDEAWERQYSSTTRPHEESPDGMGWR
jgi:hypothetical protein